jgi:hypothetical protein
MVHILKHYSRLTGRTEVRCIHNDWQTPFLLLYSTVPAKGCWGGWLWFFKTDVNAVFLLFFANNHCVLTQGASTMRLIAALLAFSLACLASPACLLDGTMWRFESPLENQTISIKTNIGAAATVYGDYYQIPKTTVGCAPEGCLRAAGHNCSDNTTKNECQWPNAAVASSSCSLWSECGGFVCSTTSPLCFARSSIVLDGYEQSKGSYDGTYGTVLTRKDLLRADQDDASILYVKTASAEYGLEAQANCGPKACVSWGFATGVMMGGNISMAFPTGQVNTTVQTLQ